MTNILSVENIYKSYGEKVLVGGVSFGLDEGDRIALVGVNGTGKSTLLKMVAGLETPESGSITLNAHATVQYLPQEPSFEVDNTVLDEVFQGDSREMVMLREYEATLSALEQTPSDEKAQEKLLRLQAQVDALGAWQLEHLAKTILTRLGITNFHAGVGTLSGGQRKRIALAKALIQPSSLLILDEPTNHIDDESAQWLENYLVQRKGALLMVTHDRYFLDRVVNRILELDKGCLYQYPGNYETFVETKVNREAQAGASEEKRQNFLRNELQWIKRGPRARGTKQKARTERYYEVLEQGNPAPNTSLELSSVKAHLGKTVVELNHVNKSYGGKQLIRDFTYTVLRDDRVGIIGPNGIGKSTLLKLMAQTVDPDSGEVVVGATVKLGYFSQEHEELPLNQRAIDYIREEAEYVETADGTTISVAQMLERFLFPGPVQWTPIGQLSGGEKRRLYLLRVLMSAPNVLLLDEPTNDFDIPTLSVLESYLDDFAGAVIVVSHDRYFLNRVADKIFAFEGDAVITKNNGNLTDYLERFTERRKFEDEATGFVVESGRVLRDRSEKTQSEDAKSGKNKSPQAANAAVKRDRKDLDQSAGGAAKMAPTERPLKFSYREQKEWETIEATIAETEQALAKIITEMEAAGGDYGRVHELYGEQQRIEAELNQLLERWTYLSEIAERHGERS